MNMDIQGRICHAQLIYIGIKIDRHTNRYKQQAQVKLSLIKFREYYL